MTHFAIAGLQLDLPLDNNQARIEREIARLMARFPWVQMVVLGELCTFGPMATAAETLPGPAEDRYCALARKHGIWLVPGTLYEKNGDRIYNTASVINPDGDVIGRYRKMFPFTPYEKGIEPGTEFLVFDVPHVGRFGVSICYDSWFPETSRTLAWMGAEVILHPTMTNTIDRKTEVAICQATAAQNQCYVIDVNNAGALGYGRSCFVGPDGTMIHECGDSEEIVPLELDLGHVRRVRERGGMALGQPLKSFRDCHISFPPYQQGTSASLALRSLGELKTPARNTADEDGSSR